MMSLGLIVTERPTGQNTEEEGRNKYDCFLYEAWAMYWI